MAHSDYLYEGNKYRTFDETQKIKLDEIIAERLYKECYKEHLKMGSDLFECYKGKLAIFRDILQIVKENKGK